MTMTSSILDIFREEARDHLASLENGVLSLERSEAGEPREDLIDDLFRHAHTLKGDARAVGLLPVQEAAQSLEDLLSELRDDPELVAKERINRSLELLDGVREAFENWSEWDGEEVSQEPKPEPEPKPKPAPEENGHPPKKEAPPSKEAEDSFTVRAHSGQLDRLLNDASELRSAQRSQESIARRLVDLSDFLKRAQALAPSRGDDARQHLDGALDQLREIDRAFRQQQSRERILLDSLEADIRDVRLMPLAAVAESFHRPLRDLAQSLGKSMRYVPEVGEVQLDKGVLEALKPALLHLLRNAIDHGLESPEERRLQGKDPEGIITLSAVRRKNRVEIAVRDDGRGIDYERLRMKVGQRSGMGPAEVAGLHLEELTMQLFEPGFSTREEVTEVSGRGVGLDVVRSTLSRLRGTIRVSENPEGGTTFLLTVPVSISTVRILTVLSGGQYYGIPSAHIARLGRIRLSELGEVGGVPVLRTEAGPVKWVPLGNLLESLTRAPTSKEGHMPYLLLSDGEHRLAVAVEDCEDETEVLLKPLEHPLHDLPGVLGATPRPDGSVQLVLDLFSSTFRSTSAPTVLHRSESEAPAVLLVDDSPTTRALMRNVFVGAGYRVRTARDGMDALERLRSHKVQLVVSDVEMPRMDGFELTREVKRRNRLPVILVTGLEKDAQRRKGLEAGADAYVVKSGFESRELLEVVRQLIGEGGGIQESEPV